MLLTLLLALGQSDLEWINGIVWALAVLSWIPQLLVSSVVLRKPRPLLRQLLLVLSPLLLATVGYRVTGLLLLAIYSDPQFMLWLPLALLPTYGALFLAVSRRGQLPGPQSESARPASGSTGNWGWGLVASGLGVLATAGLVGVLIPQDEDWGMRKAPVAAVVPPTRFQLWIDSLDAAARQDWDAQDRRAQLREDSLRAIEPNSTPAPQPW